MNRVEITGGLTRDPELRFLPSGTAVCSMTVAVNDAVWSSKESAQVVRTTYVSVTAWSSLGEEVAEADLRKGDEVYVLGKLTQSKFEKSDGTSEQKTRVAMISYSVIRSKSGATQRPADPEPPRVGEEPF